ncbi:MAG: FAD-binding oxidoreductase [Alphaproteobacteria bacterium]|nr:FAD-binding oxidoreductase [Alphaproteobacteria bacterium]
MTAPDLAAPLAARFPQLALRAGASVTGADPGFHADNLRGGVMALPSSVDELSALMAFCNAQGICVVPQGGRTGLAGGAVSAPGALIISTQKMNRIVSLDAVARLAVVEAGVTLGALQAAAGSHGLSPGIDLGARDTATIGGMISTNAGGIEAFRHGVMRARVSGLEAVLADGTVMSDMAQVSKCNEGLDVKQLFMGAEGTLGIVTRAVIRLVPSPRAKATALVAAADTAHALAAFHALNGTGQLLAFELMNPRYFKLAAEAAKEGALLPLAGAGFVFVVEMQGADEAQALSALEEGLGSLLESGQVADAVIAKSSAEARRFWILREDSWVVDRAFPHCLWFDVTVPLSQLDPYLRKLDDGMAAVKPDCAAFVIGHLGDGNLHITVAGHEDLSAAKAQVEGLVYEGLKAMGGSFSAEHGIGLEKRAALLKYGGAGKRAAMQAVKQALDSQGIMNPGKVL